MRIKTRITFKEYLKLLFGLAYKKPIMKVLIGVAFFLIIWIVGYYSHLLPVPEPEIYQNIALSIIPVVQPLMIYWTIKRNYESSNHLGETLEIDVTQAEIKVRGESFYTEIGTENIFKIDEENHWFLVYQNSLSAILISKKVLNETETKELRTILRSMPDIPVHLKDQS